MIRRLAQLAGRSAELRSSLVVVRERITERRTRCLLARIPKFPHAIGFILVTVRGDGRDKLSPLDAEVVETAA
jgi:hypothetical protein